MGSRRYIPMAPAIAAVAAVSCLFTTSLLKCDSSLNSMQRSWRAWLARLPEEADLLVREACHDSACFIPISCRFFNHRAANGFGDDLSIAVFAGEAASPVKIIRA